MATPVWNQLAAPNFSAGNALITHAMDQLTKAGEGLQGVAKQYKDTLYKRNLGAIQEYVNSAKTLEELQSEGFQTGLAKLTGNMAGKYDALAKAQLVDKANDTLLSRKANQVSIARNEFDLNQNQLEANQKQAISNIFAISDPTMRKAAIDQAVKDKQFNSSLYLQTLAAELTGKTNQQAYDYNAETWDTRKEALTLGNDAIRNRMKNDDRAAATAEMNAKTNRLQAEAAAAKAEAERKAKQNSYISTGVAAIDAAKKDIAKQIYGSGLNTDPEKTFKKWTEKTTAGFNFDPAPNTVVELITKHPVLSKLPDNLKILHAENALSYLRESENFSNPAWWFTSNSEDTVLKQGLEESFKNFNQQANTIENNATTPLYRKMVLEHAQKTGANAYAAAKDLGLDELTIYKSGIPSQLAAEAKIKYASSDKSIPEDQFIENEINIATNPDYASLNKPLFPKPKQEAANVPAQSSRTVLNTLGTGSYEDKVALIGSELKKTRDPIQIAFLNNELKKLEKVVPPAVKDPSQEPSALAAQEQRMNNRALTSLAAQVVKQNGQPFVVPAITAKLEETKPRELTPAEKQQGERMTQAAMVRLAGAKLKEKQAEVQKQFPDTPLKQLAKAATPVPSPLVPVESQNAFKSRDNNLSINLSTGKSVPSKDPVPMPNVSWGKPVEVVTMNPMVAKLPQYKAVATFVEDGDTFKATSKEYATKGTKANGNVLCRVDSVDAPETPHLPYKKGQPYGEEARKKLQQMILNKEVSIRIVKPANGDPNETGLYGRDICQIEVEGANVSTELIRAGAAWLYRDYNYYFTGLETVEANAKAEGRGLFNNPDAVYPPTAKHNGSLKLR